MGNLSLKHGNSEGAPASTRLLATCWDSTSAIINQDPFSSGLTCTAWDGTTEARVYLASATSNHRASLSPGPIARRFDAAQQVGDVTYAVFS